jgi:hypothetical protein
MLAKEIVLIIQEFIRMNNIGKTVMSVEEGYLKRARVHTINHEQRK